MSRNYLIQQSNGKMGVFGNLNEETFGGIFSDQEQKNGFALAINNFEIMNGMFLQMKNKCEEIIILIDNELKK